MNNKRIAGNCSNIFKLTMRTFFFLCIATTFAFSPKTGLSQDVKIKIESDVTLSIDQVFDLIQEQTGYTFVYNHLFVKNAPKLKLKKGVIKTYELLDSGLAPVNGTYQFINNKTIVVSELTEKKIDEIQQSVTGVVFDQNNSPLPGATIVVKGKTKGTTTDFEGQFSIDISRGDILLITHLGYNPEEIQINDQTNLTVILQENAEQLEEVTVAGFRKSLEEGIDIKKTNINAVDAIVAEDIAKFPQSNLAEAIQRVSGVQIRRDNEGGVGNAVSVRGLPSEYTQVTLNGDALPNSTDGRSYDFNTLPAEIFKQVEVLKAPKASSTEGGIGGSINLVTKKPFELKDRIVVVTAEGIRNTQPQDDAGITPKLSVTYGNKWNDKFGLIAGVFYNQFFNTSEAYDVVRYNPRSYDLDNDGVNEFEDIQIPLPRYVSNGQEVKRLSLNATLQYQVNKDFDLVLEALYVKNDQTTARYAPLWLLQNGNDPSNIIVEDGGLVRSITYGSVTTLAENQQQTNLTKNYRWSIGGKYKLPNDWKLGAKFSHAFNKRDSERFRYYANNTNTATYSIVEDLQFFDLQTETNYSNADEFVMTQARRYLWDYSDEIFNTKLNIAKKFSQSFELEFGGSFRDRTKTQQYFFRRDDISDEPFRPVAALLTGFLENVDRAKGHTEFLVHDFDAAHDLYGSTLDLEDFEVINRAYDINEKISAGYIQGNLRKNKFSANAGVRVVKTKILSRGYELDDATQIFQVREIPTDYIDFLPSVNLKWEFSRGLFARAGAARVITRPSLQRLSAYRIVNDVTNVINSENPELDPFRANQYDISLEWYPKPETLISLAGFYKDIESFISNQTRNIIFNGEEYELRQPVNGNNAKIRGIEIGFQQPFTFLPGILDGLGIVANFTFAESDFRDMLEDGSLETYPLPNNSERTYNITPYYEKNGFSFRVATNFRSKFLRDIPNPVDGLKYRDDVKITDIASSYEINENFGITLNVLNAFNAQRYEYIRDERFMDNASFFGITYQFGARYKF